MQYAVTIAILKAAVSLYAVAMPFLSAVVFHCAIIKVAIFVKPVALVQAS
jgi:hypothetical protein